MTASLSRPGRALVLALALAAIAAALYLPAAGFDFINYDEGDYVVGNPRIRQGLTLEGIRWAFTTPYASHYIPLTWVSFMADATLHGMDPAGFHLANVALHAANTSLLFLALMAFTGAFWPSALTAVLFALHPLNVETVAWVYERKGLLSAFFCLLTLLAYVRYVRRPGPGRGLAVAACFLPALLSKPAAIALPAALLILDWWPLGRLRAPFLRRLGLLALEKVPLFVLSGAFGVVLLLIFRKGDYLVTSVSLGGQTANSIVSYLLYLLKVVWPSRLSVAYLIPEGGHPWWLIALAAAALAGATLAVLASARRRPYLAAGWLWFVTVMFPTSSLLNLGFQAMADRYAYLPVVGIFLAAAWWAAETARRRPGLLKAVAAAAVLVLLGLGSAMERQLFYWKDSASLFHRALELDRNNWLAWHALGTAYLTQGRNEEALDALRRTVVARSDYAQGYNNLGLALYNLGRLSEASEAYRRALVCKPDYAEAFNNLGAAEERAGRTGEAEAAYRRALAVRRDFAGAAANLGVFLARSGRSPLAVEPLQTALALEPDNADALLGLGIASYDLGRLGESAGLFEKVLRLRPKSADAWNNIGAVREKQGRLPEAVEAYRKALELNPRLADTWYNLGLLYDRLDRAGEAAGAFARAVALKPGDIQARSVLLIALTRKGDMPGARKEYEELKALDPAAAAALKPRLPR